MFAGLAIALLSLQHQRPAYIQPLRRALSWVVAPVQYTVNFPSEMFHWGRHQLQSREALIHQNQVLKANQLLLEARVQKLTSLQNENAALRALLRSAPTTHDKVLVTQLLAVANDRARQTLWIDKGALYAVYLGQPVLDAQGVMGQVVEVDDLAARVMLLTDRQSAIPVQDSNTGVRGVVIGNGRNQALSLINVPHTVPVHEGDLLVTSGLGQVFPLGYPVGVVSQIRHDPGQRFTQIEVEPKAALAQSRDFLLVWSAGANEKAALTTPTQVQPQLQSQSQAQPQPQPQPQISSQSQDHPQGEPHAS